MSGIIEARGSVSLSHNDWNLHRKGPIDAARHTEKVKEAIKDNLADIIAEESIITSDGKKIVKVPVRSLNLPHFKYNYNQRADAGTGDGKSNVGDVIGRLPQKGPGKGKGAGNEPGVDYYEAEVTIDDLAELLFADLGLPYLKPKKQEETESESIRYNDVRKTGPMGNLDKRRTIMENLRRRAMERKVEDTEEDENRNGLSKDKSKLRISTDDLRFKTWNPDIKKQSKAVILAMRDVSGSMGEFEKYITRSAYFWMVRFLRHKYNNVEIKFITHHTEAKVVEEQEFFNLGESGGTKVSSAYQLALDMIKEKYDPEVWNIYPFHFSDGDNWGDTDNKLCVELIQKLLNYSNLFGYGEIRQGGHGSSNNLYDAYSKFNNERFVRTIITEKKDVYPALQKFFSVKNREGREGAVSRI